MQPCLGFSVRVARPGELDEVVQIDDEATELYRQAGLDPAQLGPSPLTTEEERRWSAALRAGRLIVAEDASSMLLGFASMDGVDGDAYLDQLSVRPRAARRGIGRALLRAAIARLPRAGFLWLTTYDHVPFNRAFYETEGFRIVPEADCPPAVLHHLEEQRRWLPAPDRRVAMRRRIGVGDLRPSG